MHRIDYLNFIEQKVIHEQFIKKIYESTKEYNNESKDVYLKYANFLKDWLLNHIATHDRLIGIAYHN